MDLHCPRCRAQPGAPWQYVQPWHLITCDECGETSAAGSWETSGGKALGDPFEPDVNYSLRPPTVFVSYTHKDRGHPTLKRLLDDLSFRARVSVWIDSDRVAPGSSIRDVLTTGIDTSDYFLYVVSAGTAERGWAGEELHIAYAKQAKDRRLRIIPVVIDQISHPPRFLDGVEFIDLTENYESGYKALVLLFGLQYTERLADFDLGALAPKSDIIQVCQQFDARLVESLRRNLSDLHALGHREFERLVAEIFDGFGYDVELTKRTRDGGRDIIAIKRREIDLRFLIECKHPDKARSIGVRPVRELWGVKSDEGASKAILATTAYFSRDAKLFFARHSWEIEGRDIDGITDWIVKYGNIKRRNP
jgi:HJR/Mrr/RecB family endonuclease